MKVYVSKIKKNKNPNTPAGVDGGPLAFLMWPSAAGEMDSGDGRSQLGQGGRPLTLSRDS